MAETLGQRLRRLRDEKALSVAGLALMVGCTEACVRSIETGATKAPSVLLALNLARALGTDVRTLALGEASTTDQRLDDLDRRLRSIEKRLPKTLAAATERR